MRHLLLAVLAIAACHNDLATGGTPASAAPATTPTPAPVAHPAALAQATPPPAGSVGGAAAARTSPPASSVQVAEGGHDFTPQARALLAVGACAPLPPPDGFPADLLKSHCAVIDKAQDDYMTKWVTPARAFFAAHVPATLPKKVVYPFAGGDLSTALTVFPEADLITTISLEPAGDPRDIDTLTGRPLAKALQQVEYELKFLYRVNFSNTLNMIGAMRAGSLPTQLIFGLSALKIHGYEVVKLRYFTINPDGTLHYIDDADLANAPDTKVRAARRNRVFANAEVQFRRPGGRIQVYRHIQQNLDDVHLQKDPRVLKYLEAQGEVSGMTKAASYLLSWDQFRKIRGYLLDHVQWMVSDATGIAPKWGKPAGFTYETYGVFRGPHIPAGNSISKNWRQLFEEQPKRDLSFRFGYYDKHNGNHLIIIHR
jgi:hypothetical protein